MGRIALLRLGGGGDGLGDGRAVAPGAQHRLQVAAADRLDQDRIYAALALQSGRGVVAIFGQTDHHRLAGAFAQRPGFRDHQVRA